jgi:hypothetical protein
MAAVIIDKRIEAVEDADSPKDAITDERKGHKLGERETWGFL